MRNTRNGLNDRRGFDLLLKLSLVFAFAGLIGMIVYSWKIGLAVLMVSAISFITLEAVSAPPSNDPATFSSWLRRQEKRSPVLVCLGDSLTHGNMSASFTPEIPRKLCQALGLPPPEYGSTFTAPLWVVNSGQNMITSHTVLQERLSRALGCYPDYILLLIGTNDVLAMYKKRWSGPITSINQLPEPPSMQNFERNLSGIIEFLQQSSPMVQIGVCTLPPLGEDLKSNANKLVREANEVIERVAQKGGDKVVVLPVFATMEAILEKKSRKFNLPVDLFHFISLIMQPLFHLMGHIFTWNRLSALFGNTLLTDGVHLNETACAEVVDLIVDWLMKKNVAKAIAVKQF